jgi:uncharacterized protein YjdB
MRNPFPKLASAALALALALSFAACSGDDDPAPIAVTGVTVAPDKLTVTGDKNATLTATVAPANAANKDVTWKSDDETVATVTVTGLAATVSGVAVGTTTITVASTGDATKKAICSVTVTPPVEGVGILPATLSVAVGAQGTLEAAVAPAGANQSVKWSSSDEAKATVVGDGLGATVTAVAPGPVTITATSTDDASKKGICTVTVTPAPDGVTIDPPELKLAPGATKTLTAIVSPADASQAVVWASDDETVATVEGSGATATVTAVAEGATRITAAAVGFPAIFGVCDVTVEAATSLKTLAAGNYHSLGVKAVGDLWAWGDNYYGQLGDGGNLDYSPTPVQVGNGTSDWATVSGATSARWPSRPTAASGAGGTTLTLSWAMAHIKHRGTSPPR